MTPIKYPDGEVTILVAEVRKVSELRMGFEVDLLCTIEVGSLYVIPERILMEWSVCAYKQGRNLFFNGRLIFHILDVENEPRKTSVPSYVE